MKKLKLNKAKLAFDMLEKEMEIINNIDDLRSYIGGNTNPPSSDCVINVFDFLDGVQNDNYNMYQSYVHDNLGYCPDDIGGVAPSDFSELVAQGGLIVSKINEESTGSSGGIALNPIGRTQNGGHIMMTFTTSVGSHAVIINGVNSDGSVNYIDPTSNSTGTRSAGSWNNLYEIIN